MRDATISRMHDANARRESLILAQLEFLKARQQAFERVVSVSSLRDRLRWLWNPAYLTAVVDAVQRNLMDEARRKMAEAAAKPHIVRP